MNISVELEKEIQKLLAMLYGSAKLKIADYVKQC